MLKYLLLALFIVETMGLSGQETVRLWELLPPTSNAITDPEEGSNGITYNVSVSELTIFRATGKNKQNKAIVICPGGGYKKLSMKNEGFDFAKWLQSEGITGVVLKYRMPNGHKEVPLDDLQEAIRYVRSKSVEWGIVDDSMNVKIGVAGFSAGGHLAAMGSTHYDSDELRPDFSILYYPVITMGEYTHEGSCTELLGNEKAANDILSCSNEGYVTDNTPPTILFANNDDTTVSPINSVMYYEALKEKQVSAALYIFPEGGHGWGMDRHFMYHHEMLSLLRLWLNSLE